MPPVQVPDFKRISGMRSDKPDTCQQCTNPAKYTCPGCLWRTCSLPCIKQHKEQTHCTGVRDKVKYKPMSQLDDLDILNDYRLLEEVGRRVEAAGRAAPRSGRHGATPPLRPAQYRLRRAAKKRGVRLEFLPERFERRRLNTTELEGGAGGRLLWRIEWRLPLADTVITDAKVPANRKLSEALERHLSVKPSTDAGTEDPLRFYRAAFETGLVRVFLQLERVQQGDRYLELPLGRTLAECLKQQIVIEFPIMVVTTEQHAQHYRTDRIEESYFSLCKQQQEAQRRARRAERRRAAGPVAPQPDESGRKVPRPQLDGVPVSAGAPPRTKPEQPALAQTQPQQPALAQTQPQRPALAQTQPQRPALAQTESQRPAQVAVVDVEPTPNVEKKAASGFGLFGADDSDLSD